jgi:alpha-beta hydrolase superfamily lysophospholipase
MNWLILRGLVREQRHWGEFRDIFEERLQKANPESRVHTMDLPGFGTEVHRMSPKTISGIVDDLRHRWVEMKKSGHEEWGILAVSLGGMVAAHWASHHAGDFKKVVLINSSMSGLSPLHHRMMPSNYPRIIKLLLSKNIVEREKKILSMTTNLDIQNILKKAEKQAEYAKDVNRLNAVHQMIAAIQFKPPKKINSPVLVLVGQGDKLVSPKCSEAIASHFGAKLISHPTANHDLACDEPMWIADRVMEWT